MLIPLGILATAGAGTAGAYDLIATAVGTGSSGTITFSSIPQSYKHLEIRFTGRTTTSEGLIIAGNLRFNGDAGTNYAGHFLQSTGFTPETSSNTSRSDILIQKFIPQNLNTVGSFAGGVFSFLDYSSTVKNKTVLGLYGSMNGSTATFDSILKLQSGLWMNTAAMTSITFTIANNFTTSSRFSLYGIRG